MRVTFALVAGLAALAGGSAGGVAASAPTAVGAAAEPPWRSDAVLHAVWGVPDGERRHEEWLNTRTGATRQVVYDANDDRLVWVSDGTRILEWGEPGTGGASLTILVDPHDPRLDAASSVLAWWHMLERGQARVVGSGELDGRPIVTVQSDKRPGADAPPDLKVFADLDRTTLLPLRVRLESGGRTTTQAVTYERLREDAVPASLFAFSRAWTTRERRLRYRELKAAPFAVYAPGERHRDLRFATAALVEQRGEGTRGLPAESRRMLYVGYVRGTPYDDSVVQLVERRRAKTNRRVRWNVKVRIAGATRRAYVAGDGLFFVNIGGTTVRGNATLSRAQIVALLRSLRRVR